MIKAMQLHLSLAALTVLSGCGRTHHQGGDATPGPATPNVAALSGGVSTIFDVSAQAFASPLPSLTDDALQRFNDGDALFEAVFASGKQPAHGGLGPSYNNVACFSCHVNAGRGLPTFDDGQGSEMLVFTSIAGGGQPEEPGGPIPAPGVGLQVQDHAIFGAQPNGKARLTWVETPGAYGDGTPYSLRRPVVTVTTADGKPLAKSVLQSPRQPSPIFGLGLLSAIPDDAIRANAARQDKVQGWVNATWSLEKNAPAVGRFGRKAARPSVREQVGKALFVDIGITNPIFPAPTGAANKYASDDFETLVYYVLNLTVPARRQLNDPQVQRGEELFHKIGCTGCHQPDWQTGDDPRPEFAHQTIHPYSDLLLHDMGSGLADGRPEFTASGSQWRTPTLWGIGLTHTVRPDASFLHDGRARTLAEAILWHGGQAEPYREIFRNSPEADREALLAFLESL